jgi:energy-coupling factor transporter ATP-binding protein EcfA2
MKITEISIQNFRLLKGVSLSLEAETTVIVGRNNSGKTSLAEFIRRLLTDKPIFRIEDFSLPVHEDFWNAFSIKSNGATDKEIRDALPAIKGTLTLNYAGDTTFGPLSDFIIDLKSDCSTAIAAISY